MTLLEGGNLPRKSKREVLSKKPRFRGFQLLRREKALTGIIEAWNTTYWEALLRFQE